MSNSTFFSPEDKTLKAILPPMPLLAEDVQDVERSLQINAVHMPDEEYAFLHETAIVEFKGTLFASWYNNPRWELSGRTPIRGRRSRDGGLTWSDIEVIADDPSGKILFCPPVYAVSEGKLYMFLNQMVSADHIHSLDLYIFDEEQDVFRRLWSRPIPFKLNTNAVALDNGKLLLPGRIGELDGFPNTPAVLISDSGKADAKWRLVKLMENGDMSDGSRLIHPEISVIAQHNRLTVLCRNDHVSLSFRSEDFGETWTGPYALDIPFVGSKNYAGTLTDGRHFAIGNIENHSRSRLALYLTDSDNLKFTQRTILCDGACVGFEDAVAWHYPVAIESNGRLCIICTVGFSDKRRGAALISVNVH